VKNVSETTLEYGVIDMDMFISQVNKEFKTALLIPDMKI